MINKIDIDPFKEKRYDIGTCDEKYRGYFLYIEKEKIYVENEELNLYIEIKDNDGQFEIFSSDKKLIEIVKEILSKNG